MDGVQHSFKAKYELSERMQIMLQRYQEQVLSGKRT